MEQKSFLERYEGNTIARIVVNAIPYVGGSIDVALSSKWSKIQQKRIEDQLNAISDALSGLEDRFAQLEQDKAESEKLYDLMYQIFDNSIKSRCPETRHGYAGVLRDAVSNCNLIPDLEEIVYQISGLRERDLTFLRIIKSSFDCNLVVSGVTVSSRVPWEGESPRTCEWQLLRFENIGLLDHPRNRMTKVGEISFEKTRYFDKIVNYLF